MSGRTIDSPWWIVGSRRSRADQTALRRPAPRVHDVAGLYLVGDRTQPGGSVRMVVLGGKLVAGLVERGLSDGRWRV